MQDAAEPTAKRQRQSEGAEFASLTLRQCHSLLKPLRQEADVHYFMAPVDHVALGIPDYPIIVKNPMDLGTVTEKLNQGGYLSVDQFVADVRLVFYNCRIYNPSTTPVGIAGHKISKVFEAALEQALASVGSAAAAHKSGGTPRAAAEVPERAAGGGGGEYGMSLRSAKNIVKSLQGHGYANAFKVPVDPVRLGIPNYFDVISHPMDLGTVMSKLSEEAYPTVADVRAAAH